MGLYDDLEIEEGVEVPDYPQDPSSHPWQTKSIGHPSMDSYKIDTDGRLLRREESYRDKTEDEKQSEADEHGFDSWDEYRERHQEMLTSDESTSPFSEGMPIVISERVLDDVRWVDHNQHGSFEFHRSDGETYWSYEARFTRGDLDEIVKLEEKDVSG